MKEMLNELSSREKKLLYFLFCFLIVVGSWMFLINPSLEKGKKLKQEYNDVLLENTNKQIELMQYITAPQELKEIKQQLVDIIKKYNAMLPDEEIDRLLTTLLINHSLTPTRLTIGEIQPVNLNNNDENNQNNEETTKASTIYQVSVDMTVSGTMTQINNAIDDLNNQDGIQISAFSYSKSTDQNNTRVENQTLKVIIYMVNK